MRNWEYRKDEHVYVADDGNWLEYGYFGADTYGLHTSIDGNESVIKLYSKYSIDAPSGYDTVAEADRLLDRIAEGWRAVNWGADEVSVTEAAKMLGVTRQRVHAMLKAGRLHGRKIGSTWSIYKASVDARLNSEK